MFKVCLENTEINKGIWISLPQEEKEILKIVQADLKLYDITKTCIGDIDSDMNESIVERFWNVITDVDIFFFNDLARKLKVMDGEQVEKLISSLNTCKYIMNAEKLMNMVNNVVGKCNEECY